MNWFQTKYLPSFVVTNDIMSMKSTNSMFSKSGFKSSTTILVMVFSFLQFFLVEAVCMMIIAIIKAGQVILL